MSQPARPPLFAGTLAISALFFMAACGGGKLPRPELGPHQPALETIDEVEYPPPPAKVEAIDADRHHGDDCVWVDGSYSWNGRRWEWEPGAWVRPPPGCYYALAEAFWEKTAEGSVLYYRNPAWYPDRDAADAPDECAEPRVCE
jgi:hypothetical protein